MSRILRASVVQTCTARSSLEETLDKLERLTRVASGEGSRVAVFPEAFIGGYPKESTFGAHVGERSAAGRDEYVKYHAAALELPSPGLSRIEAISKETNVFLVVGIIERDGVHGFVGKHRKLMPTATERLIWGQGDGSTLSVVKHEYETGKSCKISATICWENYMPLLRSYYYSKGVELYCAPTVDARPEWQSTMQHIALEGRCFVLAACQFAQEKDFDENHSFAGTERDPERIIIAGGSVIVSPLGKILAGPLRREEGVLTADLDLDDIIRGKFDLDVCGHYARPDVFKLSVTAE